ncbi:MAG: hypothetical protein PHP14_01610 [Candidatus Pacebacteria bacterium]|nr:hypothetical protein [Candidatus Paceibacterota bacterium]
MFIKSIYNIFLALLIALFVGFGIDSFYISPKYPEYPNKPISFESEKEEDIQKQMEINQEFEEKSKEYREELKQYNKNVSIIVIGISIVILVLSLTLLSKIHIIANGVLLGGVFTTVYGLIRGIMSDSSVFRFIIITIGLVITLVIGYIKFIKSRKN